MTMFELLIGFTAIALITGLFARARRAPREGQRRTVSRGFEYPRMEAHTRAEALDDLND